MRIGAVIFTLLLAFIITISVMTSNVRDKREGVKTKIEQWDIKKGRLKLKIVLIPELPVFFQKNLNCKIYNKDKKELSNMDKIVEIALKETKRITVTLGKADKSKVRFIDCNFIDD